jgi:hypothetical protein
MMHVVRDPAVGACSAAGCVMGFTKLAAPAGYGHSTAHLHNCIAYNRAASRNSTACCMLFIAALHKKLGLVMEPPQVA